MREVLRPLETASLVDAIVIPAILVWLAVGCLRMRAWTMPLFARRPWEARLTEWDTRWRRRAEIIGLTAGLSVTVTGCIALAVSAWIIPGPGVWASILATVISALLSVGLLVVATRIRRLPFLQPAYLADTDRLGDLGAVRRFALAPRSAMLALGLLSSAGLALVLIRVGGGFDWWSYVLPVVMIAAGAVGSAFAQVQIVEEDRAAVLLAAREIDSVGGD